MAKLSKFEIESYQARGYVVPNHKIPVQMLERLRLALEETIKSNPDVRPEQLASIHTSKAGPSDTKGHSTFLEVALDTGLVDLVSGVLGPKLIMWALNYSANQEKMGWKSPCIKMGNIGQFAPLLPVQCGWH